MHRTDIQEETILNNISQQDEIHEYNEFMLKLSNKAREINEDFQKLSPQNQLRVNRTIQEGIKLEALMKVLNSMNWR